ncbi:MAG TPA: hypothetical protein VD866_33285 [Urbifossiella sp.]|nr:hypothetical protein [Urbifossiella sp.]
MVRSKQDVVGTADRIDAGPGGSGDDAIACEEELVGYLLADSVMLPMTAAFIGLDRIRAPDLRRILGEMYAVRAAGDLPDWGTMKRRLVRQPALARRLAGLHAIGDRSPLDPGERRSYYDGLLKRFLNTHRAPTSGGGDRATRLSNPAEVVAISLLAADPSLIPAAVAAVKPHQITNPLLRRTFEEMVAAQEATNSEWGGDGVQPADGADHLTQGLRAVGDAVCPDPASRTGEFLGMLARIPGADIAAAVERLLGK